MNLVTESNVARLRQVAGILQAQNQHLLKVLTAKCAELDKLKGRPGDLQRVLEGLEAVGGQQVESGADSGADTAGSGNKPRKPQTGHGPTPQPDIAHEPQLFELDEADQICPKCGDTLAPEAGDVETSEMVDVVEVTYRVIEVQRQGYECCRCDFHDIAPGPDRAVDGGRYSLAFGVKVAIDKYVHHLPLERQVRIMAQHGLRVTSQALWDQVWALATLLLPVYDGLYEHILSQRVIGLDQTGWPNLNSRRAKKWQMWALTSVDAAYHQIRDDKSAASFTALVGDFEGTIVCDALSTHGAGAREGPGIELAGCWAHIRRKFAEAEPNFPEARQMLDLIRELYDIEGEASSAEHRAELRSTKSRAALERMKAWMASVSTLSSTDLGSAIKHTVKFWDRLTRFAADAEIWLDNNRTERAFRGPVVGRRNHFGSKSRRGTRAAAILYSVIESAKAIGVDPAAYITEAARIAKATDGDEHLMPWDFEPASRA
ncbi:MAG: IS66 family transposase [bacterium]|nr:IS66 family transposase [bacterium]